MQKSDELESRLEEVLLDLNGYSKWGRYKIGLREGDVEKQWEFLADLLKRAYSETAGA